MDLAEFLDLRSTHNPHRWILPVESKIRTHGGFMFGGAGLDNTLRVVHLRDTEWVLRDTEWVLCDIRMHAVDNGYAHGTMHLWSEDAHLLATGSQSMVVRDRN